MCELGRQWSADHRNRLIKVPATPAGLDALEPSGGRGVKLNVTLIFTMRQYLAARDAIWRGARARANLDDFKSVYSIFVSRLDVYTEKAVPAASPRGAGMVGILNAKRIWAENQHFWSGRPTPLRTGDRLRQHGHEEAQRSALEICRGLCRQRHPNQSAGHQRGRPAERTAASLAKSIGCRRDEVVEEIDRLVDMQRLEETLMSEGIAKFATRRRSLLALVAEKRPSMAPR